MPLAIPIRLISAQPCQTWEEDTHTLEVSRNGARTRFQHDINVADQVKLLRLDTGQIAEARVVWERRSNAGSHEIGLDTSISNEKFWGL